MRRAAVLLVLRPPRLGAVAALAASALACGPDVAFDRAAAREGSGAWAAAAESFQAFAARHPADARAPEALVRAARIYTYAFQRCPQARPLLERAARDYPRAPWAEEARRTLLDCPEYLPTRPAGAWTYVDSQTGGKNMRLLLAVRAATAASSEVEGSYYAGKTRFRTARWRYSKDGWAVWETDGKDRVPILTYPYKAGRAWQAKRGGKAVEFRIESAEETVTVRGGTYHHCLKVREAQRGLPAWKYDYYAPGVGRVKTTVGGRGFENPNTELLSARLGPPLPPQAREPAAAEAAAAGGGGSPRPRRREGRGWER